MSLQGGCCVATTMDAPIRGRQCKGKRKRSSLKVAPDECTTQSFVPFPEEVLMEILSWVPPMDVIRHCRLVSTRWRDVSDSSSLWVALCQRKGYLPKEWSRHPKDWKKYYYICSQRRNLLKNPSAEKNFQTWSKSILRKNCWRVEELSEENGQLFPDPTVTKCFVGFWRSCEKSQLIDLRRAGYSEELLDREQPPIIIRDWYAGSEPFDCPYLLTAELLSKEKEVLRMFPYVDKFKYDDGEWREASYTFSDYGPGVCYVYFNHGVSGLMDWSGIRFTNSSVTIEPEDLTVTVK